MQNEEDKWIAALSALPDASQRARIYDEVRSSYAVLARKAKWMTEHLRRRGVPITVVSEEQHLGAWIDFLDSAASALQGSDHATTKAALQTIYLGFHHSSYPLTARAVLHSGAHVLVTRTVPWLQAIGGNFINLMDSPRDVLSVCQRGEPVYAMMDYCYEQTRSACDAPFLSYPARTPTGLLNLVRRYHYSIVCLTHTGHVYDGISAVDAKRMGVKETAAWLNSCIERQVVASPSRWLLWASLDRRLKWVDYDA